MTVALPTASAFEESELTPRATKPVTDAPKGVRAGSTVVAVVLAVFVMGPLLVIVGVSLNTKPYWEFPPSGITLKWYKQLFSNDEFVRSLQVTFIAAALVTAMAMCVSMLAAVGISRGGRGSSSRLATISLIPLLFPHVVLGVALLTMYLRLGVTVTILTLALAQLILVLPFAIRLLLVGLSSISPNLERAAQNLGASPRRAFVSVVLPLVQGATLTAALVVFVRAMDEASVALYVNSPHTITVPVRLLIWRDTEPGPLIAAGGTVLLVAGLLAAIIIVKFIGLGRAFGVSTGKG